MESVLALMCGAGDLPGRVAAEARRVGWHVVAFAFGDVPAGLARFAERIVPSDIADVQTVLAGLSASGARAAVFAGKFWKQDVFARYERADEAGRRLAARGLADSQLADALVALFGSMGIEILDPRQFLEPWLASAPQLTARIPSGADWEDIHAGFRLARLLAREGVGQTVVRARGVTVAVECLEGTDEAIRRGLSLAGAGCVVVKAVGPDHDYRFDVPAIGAATLRVLAEGRASALALDRGRVLLLDGEETVQIANRAEIAIVSVADGP